MHVIVYLFALTLSATDGHEIERKVMAGPMEIQACELAQVKTGIQHVVDGQITVYQCGAAVGPR